MAFELRPYQYAAVEALKETMKKCIDPIVIEAATGGGKSILISEIAKWLNNKSGKKVLCLAPSKELCEQNAEKYKAYGFKASYWSASVGKKEMRNSVVFGTPMSVWNDIEKFKSQFTAVICDESHMITPTIKSIIESIKAHNKYLRVIGFTATPYRMGSGYIYEIDENGKPVGDDCTKNPYFKKLVYRITAQELVKQGYLTQPIADAELAARYDASGLSLNRMGNFDSKEIEQTFEGKGRLTSDIVEDVVKKSANRKGVMFFAATVKHAKEIMLSLPAGNARLITGETKKKERNKIIDDFKNQKFKYLVNVSVLTTGFDAPHVDVVAILRATESASLFQQIIGRGLRLADGKLFCLVLDYAGNIERHQLEDDLFDPKITVSGGGKEALKVEAKCPICNTVNEFTARKDANVDLVDSEGYQLDLTGDRVEIEGQPLPAHMGRRCFGEELINGHFVRCNHRWSLKECPECSAENDIAARYCSECRAELIDPNEKLMIDYKKMKKNPRILTTDKVLAWSCKEWVSQSGNQTLRVDYTTEYRSFPVWYTPESNSRKQQAIWENLCESVFGKGNFKNNASEFISGLKDHNIESRMPFSLTAKKEGDFFTIFAHNLPVDVPPIEEV